MDLKLVSMEDLLTEIIERTDCCVGAYTRTVDSGSPTIETFHSHSNILTKIGLCAHLKHGLLQAECLKEEWGYEKKNARRNNIRLWNRW